MSSDDTTPTPEDGATPLPMDDVTPTPPPEDATPAAPRSTTPQSVAGSDEPRFVPGTVLAERYRIIGLLGRGGMGEVYRADDLKLGQSVALKFLPVGLDHDPERLQRFLGEVKVALHITHPNVCRVYDIGEVDGAHYLSMEYIDGEDLSSLLRRIGRLPEDKAIDIARQLCAGLAAAHDKGILHRDLKPANVMLDGRGDVRITDFGLAGLAEGFTGLEIRAGTPAFMAPEQLSGKEVTVRSDIYSLGLVLYELFTGKRAFQGNSMAEISALQHSGPANPTSHVTMLDPTVEQVILRCLEADPGKRPASVLKVALGLPGGDPLAAALAAGETPSPEMVAEAGDDSLLEPKKAIPLLIFSILGLLGYSWINGSYELLGRVPMPHHPQALVYKIEETLATLGYEDPPFDREFNFTVDRSLLRHLGEDPSPDRWSGLSTKRPSAINMWYRQSPRQLVPQNVQGRVFFNDPMVRVTGMVNVRVDSSGRLQFLLAAPPQHEPSAQGAWKSAAETATEKASTHEVDPADLPSTELAGASIDDGASAPARAPPAVEPPWDAAFAAAELELERFQEVEPEWLPEVYCNQRAAWIGNYPDQPDLEIRIEACAYEGRLVYFDILYPWSRAFLQQRAQQTTAEVAQVWIVGIVFVALLTGATLLVRRNLRLGRGDRRGALRLAGWTVATAFLGWMFQASHVAHIAEAVIFVLSLGNMLFMGGMVWVLYIALEPFVRRRWPESLVSWSRLLAGRIRDPLVGRHMLYGAALGVGVQLLAMFGKVGPTLFGAAGDTPSGSELDALLGTRWVLGEIFYLLSQVILNPMTLLFLLVLFRVVLRNSWVALAVFVALFTFLGWPNSEMVIFGVVSNVIIWTAFGLVMMRFGLVAFISAAFMTSLANQPLTLDFTTWYAGHTLTMLAVGILFILAAFRIAMAGRPVFAEDD